MINDVVGSPRPRFMFRKSAAVSPTVTAMSLISQKSTVTCGHPVVDEGADLRRQLQSWNCLLMASVSIGRCYL